MHKENKKTWMMVAASILVVLLLFSGRTKEEAVSTVVAGAWDISEQVKENSLGQYLVKESDFDYTHPEIQQIAAEIKSSSESPYDAVKKTAKYVYDTIDYDAKVTITSCYTETASSTLELGKSDCVGMTRVNVALLRAMGIPARSVGGCLKSTERCSPLFAVAPAAQTVPLREGDFKKRGALHEWLEAWVPEKGWMKIEATAGQVFSSSCGQYIVYAYDNNQYDRCTIQDQNFWNLCSIS